MVKTKKVSKKALEKTEQVGIRMPVTILERIDQHAARLRSLTPGVGVTRADAIRALVVAGLNEVERKEQAAAAR